MKESLTEIETSNKISGRERTENGDEVVFEG